jgi:hypothetical protein
LITTKARLNGYFAPQKMELTGKSGGPVEIKKTADAEISQMLERLTQEEKIEFLKLFNKANGTLVEPHITPVKEGKADDEGGQTGKPSGK